MTLTSDKIVLSHGEQTVSLPKGAQIVDVSPTLRGPALFILFDTEAQDAPPEDRSFVVADVREHLPEDVSGMHYRGLAKVPGGYSALVFETTEVKIEA